VGVLIIANLTNFNEGGKTALEGAKNIDPILKLIKFIMYKDK
jgi:hypothetical protein